MRFFKTVASALIVGVSATGHATYLGTIGPVYPVAETSAVDMILKKLKEKQRTGELQRLEKEAIARSLGSVENIKPVEGITTVRTRATRLIDPSVTYGQAVKTDDGHIVIPAGTRINPLEMVGLSKTLVFFDGRDFAQREAVRKLVADPTARIKPILVAGPWMEMTKAWKTQVFFDQNGSLSRRFGVHSVPTMIRQKGAMLELEEIPPGELR